MRDTPAAHGLKISYRAKADDPSAAIRLFCALAKDSGDAEMTTATAKQWLKPGSQSASDAKS